MFLEIEAGLAVVALALAFAVPNLGSRWFGRLEQSFGNLAQRRALAVVVVGLTALALRAALLPILPIPHPLIQDEFAYLLGADTFAHGRLANPTPALWTHFESLMILLKPTYSSKYPPAQSLFMAAGQVLLGHPFWGVWLSVGLMCGAICWMLQAWVGEGWALLGGFLAAGRIAAVSYWADSYWGGAVAALGGALVLGALPRLRQEHRVRNALVMGLGLAILANSRPYEGLVLSIPVVAALAVWMLGKERPAFSVSLRQVVLPLFVFLGVVAAWMGFYNWRVTGNAMRMPFREYQEQYDPTPYFFWHQEKPLPEYRHAEMKEWEEEIDLGAFRSAKTPVGLIINELQKGMFLWIFYIGPYFTLLLAIAFVLLPHGYSWKNLSSSTRFLLLALGISLLGFMLEVYFYPHYGAPVTCLFLALILVALRHLREWLRHGKPTGRFLVRAVPALTVLMILARVLAGPMRLHSKFGFTPWLSGSDRTSAVGRSEIVDSLLRQPERDVVLVRYSKGLYDMSLHSTGMWPPSGPWEWVYNGADIDNQKVIWAQDMGPTKNQELIDYYKGRRVWLLYADDQPPKLAPYAEAGGTMTEADRK
ncbi:MAG TPA: hypothetical protein VGW37_15090 [Terriglobia bacterium]|nr:hypothetical protein [Terriglobia bacterium]